MPQTRSNVIVHAVFSTNQRVPSLTEEIQSRLYAYLGGILRDQGSQSIVIGGYTDHVHLLFLLDKTRSLSDTMRVVKANSSKWIKETFPVTSGFSWQAGYAAFSVGNSEVPRVRTYIENQSRHHATTTFQDELRTICLEQGVEIDERYVWD